MKYKIDWWNINIAVSRILGLPEIGYHKYDEYGNPHYEGEEREYTEDRYNEVLFTDIKLACSDGKVKHKVKDNVLYIHNISLVKWILDKQEFHQSISDRFLQDCCSQYFVDNEILLNKLNTIRKERAGFVVASK